MTWVYFFTQVYRYEDSSRQLIRPNGFIIDCSNTFPPHKTIYEGLPNKPDCYCQMAAYLDSLVLKQLSILGSPRNSNHTAQYNPQLDLAGYPTDSLVADSNPKPPDHKAKTVPNNLSNTFLVPQSPFMPTAIDSWERALRILSNHNQALHPPPGVNSAFWVPPVHNIISPVNPETVSGSPLHLTSKQWRSLLEVTGWRYGEPDTATTTGTASDVDLTKSLRGLAARNLKDRLPYLTALHRVMRTWKGDKLELLMMDAIVNDESANFDLRLKRFEYALASFYTTSFLNVFGCAACIPYTM
ncbi:hypothetical protein GYMLUDRAFT_253224 [Collybiopsis luxurians FD-317 M1]|uniref:Uncharacterized protein n=1 Tax=Collybiopsis luxurians FD-317 M1 TaxID=944289 RepID=A0A0D0BXD7_9AGAR|nr:hypothetical protein GYMLUDRAFT_253224 [Collybiopsis luxurians FD-317 M1]